MSKFTIIRDTREKKGLGWWFDESSHCTGTEVKKLELFELVVYYVVYVVILFKEN